jgi:hypothetical protein
LLLSAHGESSSPLYALLQAPDCSSCAFRYHQHTIKSSHYFLFSFIFGSFAESLSSLLGMIDFLCVAGMLAGGIILLRSWLRHSHWWLAALCVGVMIAGIHILLSAVATQLGRQGLIGYGIRPTAALRALLLLAISTVVFQTGGIIGCCIHFMRRSHCCPKQDE